MIKINELKESDVGRPVLYHREYCDKECGILTSWNKKYVFVRFKAINGEACEEEDITFMDEKS